jgi:hypothetical protein
LSIFTTVTPLPQEVSIRAARRRRRSSRRSRCWWGRHDWLVHKPGDDARERAFHPGDDNENVAGGEAVAHRKEAMQAGDADIGDAFDFDAEDRKRDGGFLGHRQIAGAGAHDADARGAARMGCGFDRDAAGGLVPDGGGKFTHDGGKVLRAGAGDEHDRAAAEDGAGDGRDLFGRLALPKTTSGKPQRRRRSVSTQANPRSTNESGIRR